MKRLRYIALLMMLCLAGMAVAAGKQFTLVIDAGHGGGDTGACGAISKEKNLTLKFALAFGRMVEANCPDVKVIYTRKTDRFVELYRRAEIANKAKADLFISFHINALPRGKVARGFQTYTLGRSKRTGKKTGVLENLEVAKRENAVIYMEKDYQQTYRGFDPNSEESIIMFEFIQDKNMENSVELAKYMQKYVCQATGRQDLGAQQDNLAVLRLSSMPGCLIELGFISTRDEERYMNSPAAERQYAKGVFNAFLAYRKRHGGNITVPYQPVEEPKPAPKRQEQPVQPEPQPEPEAPAQPEAESLDTVQSAEASASPQQPAPAVQDTVPQPADVAPVFKVQILVGSNKLSPTDAQFKGLKDVSCYREGTSYKYTVGNSANYQEIYQLRKQILDKFPQAFIIAFKNGERMDVHAAIAEYRKNKNRK